MKRSALAILGLAFVLLTGLIVMGTPTSAQAPVPKVQAQYAQCTTDALGECSVWHGLNAIPDAVLLTPRIESGQPQYTMSTVAATFTTNSFRVRASVVNQAITFWFAAYSGTGIVPPVTTTTTPVPEIGRAHV